MTELLLFVSEIDCSTLMNMGKEICIIDRQKLKETDEYKRAMKEEWAARNRIIQIQSKEAQQSRKEAQHLWKEAQKLGKEAQKLRREDKAERMRLDMERRQNQRLNELRQTQKKNEELMKLKEIIRIEIWKKLSKLEVECQDMASVLRSLGISVGSEVRAACKRALFMFHPDRVSKSDTRLQVESEEKFKLISRMKEKFMLS